MPLAPETSVVRLSVEVVPSVNCRTSSLAAWASSSVRKGPQVLESI